MMTTVLIREEKKGAGFCGLSKIRFGFLAEGTEEGLQFILSLKNKLF